jgi:hypothetical protein
MTHQLVLWLPVVALVVVATTIVPSHENLLVGTLPIRRLHVKPEYAVFMNARPGRPPKKSDGKRSTLTVKLAPDLKDYLVETSEALDMPMAEFLASLIRRDRGY